MYHPRYQQYLRNKELETMNQEPRHLLFVYGSLREGMPLHDAYLKDFDIVMKTLTVEKYTMLNLGWYPGVVQNPAAVQIAGELYNIPISLRSQLDRVEGHPSFYERKEIHIVGSELPAWMYILPDHFAERKIEVIGHGDWVKFRMENATNRALAV